MWPITPGFSSATAPAVSAASRRSVRSPAGHDEAAPAGQCRLCTQPTRAVGVADQPPDLELALDLHRQVAALVDPLDRIACAGAASHIHLVGAQRGEAGPAAWLPVSDGFAAATGGATTGFRCRGRRGRGRTGSGRGLRPIASEDALRAFGRAACPSAPPPAVSSRQCLAATCCTGFTGAADGGFGGVSAVRCDGTCSVFDAWRRSGPAPCFLPIRATGSGSRTGPGECRA